MVQVTIRLQGDKERVIAFERYRQQIEGANGLAAQFSWRTLKDAEGELEIYPPAPSGIRSFRSERIGRRGRRTVQVSRRPGKGYVRTGNLGRRWQLVEVGPGAWRLSNDASRRGRSYAQYVHGNSAGLGQAWMHVGRWKLMRRVVDSALVVNVARYRTALAMLARELGLGA